MFLPSSVATDSRLEVFIASGAFPSVTRAYRWNSLADASLGKKSSSSLRDQRVNGISRAPCVSVSNCCEWFSSDWMILRYH